MRIHTRIFIPGFLFLLCVFQLSAQLNPVDWSFEAVKDKDGEYDLIFTAAIEPGWFLYSQYIDEGGPIPTSFTFRQTGHFELTGKTKEEGEYRKEGHDELFDMEVIKYGKQAVFTQHIKANSTGNPVEGDLEFMTCNDETCLPPRTVTFKIDLPK